MSQKPKNIRVLLVDDSETVRETARLLLEDLGSEVETAGGAAEALSLLERSPFGLVLMDCDMPGVDGFAATRRIRAREGDGGRIPVVAMTALDSPEDRARCLGAGMDDFVGKPLHAEAVDAVLRRWCAGPTVCPAAAQGEARDDQPFLDEAVFASVRRRAATRPGMLEQLIEGFLRDADVRLGILREALASRDAAAFRHQSHALRGAASSMGARRVSSCCRRLEGMALEENLAEAGPWLDRLRAEIDLAAARLRGAP